MKNFKKILMGMILMMVLALCAVPMSPVHASEYVKNGFNRVLRYSPDWPESDIIRLKEFQKGSVKNLKVKFSNKKIASAEILEDEEPGSPYISVMAKKTGKTKITITAKVKGKKVSCKGTITVINRKGLTKFTIDGENRLQDVAYDDDSTSFCFVNTNKKSVKIEYKLAAGWKIEEVTYSGNFKSGVYVPVVDNTGFNIVLSYKKGKTKLYNNISIAFNVNR